MQSRTKRHLSAADLDALLRASTGVGCRVEAELTDGWFAAAYRVVLDDGRPAVVKLAPPPDAPVLRYERGITVTEAMVYGRLATLPPGQVPTPQLFYSGPEFVVLSVLDGTPWDKVADGLPPVTQSALRRELGAVTARLHTLTAPDGRFGYPAPEAALSAPDWPTAFTAMVDALLQDAADAQDAAGAAPLTSPLDVSPAVIRALVAEGKGVLGEVTEPRLVHFDLWPGNVFVDVPGGGEGPRAPRITGIIDHERAFWGDPVAELVSLAFGGDTGPDSDLVAGYTEAGGHLDFTPAVRHRLALYRLYLGLLLVVECGPRGYVGDHLAFCRRTLAEAVAELRALG
ncbi:aminoglycoside phosphotransferase family protein [Streptomyces longwoodensis]|uniref:phosphotransferase family protein n=1 Tax=Streptomyces longwoodensis TaxID=68231 RepID=UPI0033CAC343